MSLFSAIFWLFGKLCVFNSPRFLSTNVRPRLVPMEGVIYSTLYELGRGRRAGGGGASGACTRPVMSAPGVALSRELNFSLAPWLPPP